MSTIFRFSMALIFILMQACATVKTEVATHPEALPNLDSAVAPFLKHPLMVQLSQFSFNALDSSRIPEQARSTLTNDVADLLYNTGAIRFVESDSVMLGKVLTQWAYAQSGVGNEISMAPIGLPDYILNAKIGSITRNQTEQVQGLQSKAMWTTRVKLYLSFVAVKDGTVIPSLGEGDATSQATDWLVGPQGDYRQSDLAKATQHAAIRALYSLLKRVPLLNQP